MQAALETHLETVKNEVLAESLAFLEVQEARHSEREEVEGVSVTISLKKAEVAAEAA